MKGNQLLFSPISPTLFSSWIDIWKMFSGVPKADSSILARIGPMSGKEWRASQYFRLDMTEDVIGYWFIVKGITNID
jgi:hypothetical protein